MSSQDSTRNLIGDATVTLSECDAAAVEQSGLLADVRELCAEEHPTVVGGRVGACLFSSFGFPAGLWVLGAVSPTGAAVVAILGTLLVTRLILVLGGIRVARVLALQVGIAALALFPTYSPLPALVTSAFFPLLGMLASVSAGARLAGAWFAQEERPREADMVIARATQANVVDIRAAGTSRRAAGAKPQARSISGDALSATKPESQKQAN
jgi:hypothetical protein